MKTFKQKALAGFNKKFHLVNRELLAMINMLSFEGWLSDLLDSHEEEIKKKIYQELNDAGLGEHDWQPRDIRKFLRREGFDSLAESLEIVEKAIETERNN